MATKKTTSPKSAKAKNPDGKSAKATKTGEGKSAKAASKRTSPRKNGGTMEKVGEVLDTMVAGAIAGAVVGAARELDQEPAPRQSATSSPKKRAKASTAEVVEEMAPGAAVGAIVGAADAVLPKQKKKGAGGEVEVKASVRSKATKKR